MRRHKCISAATETTLTRIFAPFAAAIAVCTFPGSHVESAETTNITSLDPYKEAAEESSLNELNRHFSPASGVHKRHELYLWIAAELRDRRDALRRDNQTELTEQILTENSRKVYMSASASRDGRMSSSLTACERSKAACKTIVPLQAVS